MQIRLIKTLCGAEKAAARRLAHGLETSGLLNPRGAKVSEVMTDHGVPTHPVEVAITTQHLLPTLAEDTVRITAHRGEAGLQGNSFAQLEGRIAADVAEINCVTTCQLGSLEEDLFPDGALTVPLLHRFDAIIRGKGAKTLVYIPEIDRGSLIPDKVMPAFGYRLIGGVWIKQLSKSG